MKNLSKGLISQKIFGDLGPLKGKNPDMLANVSLKVQTYLTLEVKQVRVYAPTFSKPFKNVLWMLPAECHGEGSPPRSPFPPC